MADPHADGSGPPRERDACSPGQDRIWEYFQNEAPESFAASAARLGYLARLARRGQKVLNIGVGAGTFEEIAIRRGLDVHSLDPSEESIARLRARFGMGDRAKAGHGQSIPFPSRMFDVVVVSEVLEHLEDDVLAATLAEIARVLAPGGSIVGTVPARENLREQVVACPHCGARFHRWGHVQAFDRARIASLLEPRFRVVRVAEMLFVTWATLNWKGRLAAAIKAGLHAVGVHGGNENIVFVARKLPSDPA